MQTLGDIKTLGKFWVLVEIKMREKINEDNKEFFFFKGERLVSERQNIGDMKMYCCLQLISQWYGHICQVSFS